MARPVGLAAPQGRALAFHGRAHPVEAVALASVAGHRVLDVEVLGALPGESGAQLGQVALVGGLPARGAGRLQFAVITAGSIRTVRLSFQPEIGSTTVRSYLGCKSTLLVCKKRLCSFHL